MHYEDEFSDKVRPVDSELLRDEAAHRESESVELLNAERVDEGGGVLCHLFNRSRHFTAGTGDAGVVEQEHFAVLGKSVGQRGIPHVIVLEPGLVVFKIYNGYWFFGRSVSSFC